MFDPQQLMQLAIEQARAGIATRQTPFGCAIARGDELVAACHNTVWATTDITAHAEINALREACRNSSQVLLNGFIVATTCEPCPMCMSALHWARVKTVYFGATIADADAAGFNELSVPAQHIVTQGLSQVQLVGDCLTDTCRALFVEWKQAGRGKAY